MKNAIGVLPVANNTFFRRSTKMKWFKSITGWDVALAAIVVITLVALWLGGCEGLNVQPEQLQGLATQTEQLSGKIDEFQQQTKLTLDSLKANGSC